MYGSSGLARIHSVEKGRCCQIQSSHIPIPLDALPSPVRNRLVQPGVGRSWEKREKRGEKVGVDRREDAAGEDKQNLESRLKARSSISQFFIRIGRQGGVIRVIRVIVTLCSALGMLRA